ncbi:hypothetical protein HZB88_03555 [archaeon]|nr:hypothetical protein [archaeon]
MAGKTKQAPVQGMDKKTLAIVGLVINLFIPGLGSIIGGKTGAGVPQLIIAVIGWILCLTLIRAIVGVPLWAIAWIWALITGIGMVKENP